MERPVSEDQSAAPVVNTGCVSASDELNPSSPEIFVCNLHFVKRVNMRSMYCSFTVHCVLILVIFNVLMMLFLNAM